jgi:hypothetical protein
VKLVKEASENVVAKLVLSTGEPRFHVGGETPLVTSFSPTSAAPGKKVTVTGAKLSQVTKVSAIAVTSLAGGASSAGVFRVLSP